MASAGNIVKQLMAVQTRMTKITKELHEMEVRGTAAGGAVSVTMTGKHRVTRIQAAPEVFKEDPDTITELFQVAFNDAVRSHDEISAERLKGISAGLAPAGIRIPGL